MGGGLGVLPLGDRNPKVHLATQNPPPRRLVRRPPMEVVPSSSVTEVPSSGAWGVFEQSIVENHAVNGDHQRGVVGAHILAF